MGVNFSYHTWTGVCNGSIDWNSVKDDFCKTISTAEKALVIAGPFGWGEASLLALINKTLCSDPDSHALMDVLEQNAKFQDLYTTLSGVGGQTLPYIFKMWGMQAPTTGATPLANGLIALLSEADTAEKLYPALSFLMAAIGLPMEGDKAASIWKDRDIPGQWTQTELRSIAGGVVGALLTL
jgi:hypothetical protein